MLLLDDVGNSGSAGVCIMGALSLFFFFHGDMGVDLVGMTVGAFGSTLHCSLIGTSEMKYL